MNASKRRYILFGLWTLFFREEATANVNAITVGSKYEVIGELFAYGVRDDLGKKVVTTINLHTLNFSGPEIVWRKVVPEGSVMTIMASAPPPISWLSFLYHSRFLVSLQGFSPEGHVPVVIEVYGSVAGAGGGLNPRVFRRI